MAKEGFRGATVNKPPRPPPSSRSPSHIKDRNTQNLKVTIEYADDETGLPLRETVDILSIRPPPPREINRKFMFNEEVDAYYNKGWWEGVITKVLENSRYLVYLRPSREHMDFGESDLRLHREWVNGIWVPPLETEGDPENLRWLGTRVWPAGGESTKLSLKEVGEGRSDSCYCISPRSSDCIKHHILVKKLHLRTEIGPAFWSWKFDEMGEVVSNSWTLKEQESFSLLRRKQRKDPKTDFWEEASKCFPSKSKKNILSYYFNVYTPRRLSIETKTSCEQVDSDDEQVDDDDDHKDSKKQR